MKQFSLVSLIFLVVANMLGAGVFTTSGIALQEVHSAHAVMLAWLIGGCLAVCGAYSYGILARELSLSGGEYLVLRTYIHPVAGFVGGLLSLFVGFSGASAFSALTLAAYLYDEGNLPLIASVVVLICWGLRLLQFQLGSIVHHSIVLLKLAILFLFILIAFMTATPTDSYFVAQKSVSPFSFATIVLWVFYSYSGFNAAIYVLGQSKKPKRDVPLAMLAGTLLITLLYLVLNGIFLYFPDNILVSGYSDIASRTALAIGGVHFALFIRVIIVAVLFSGIFSMFVIGPSVYQAMSQDGLLPFGTHRLIDQCAVTIQAFIVILIIWSTQLRELLSYIGLTLSFSMLMTVGVIFKIKKIDSVKTLLAMIPVIIFTVATCAMIILTSIHRPWESVISFLTVCGAAGLYAIHYFKTPTALNVSESR